MVTIPDETRARMDVVYLGIAALLFASTVGLIRLCERV
jgi:hypothetical protein